MVVKTSKEWVLPPRPKPGRKPICEDKKKEEKKKTKKETKPRKKYTKKCDREEVNSEIMDDVLNRWASPDVASLKQNIANVDRENTALKATLLSLIHEYKHLREMVLKYNPNSPLEFESLTLQTSLIPSPNSPVTTPEEMVSHKRSFQELNDTETGLLNELISDMNGLSHKEMSTEFEGLPVIPETEATSKAEVDPVEFGIPEAFETKDEVIESFLKFDEEGSEPSDATITQSKVQAIESGDATPKDETAPSKSFKFSNYKDFEKLDTVEDSDLDIDFEDDEDELPSTGLSRTISPSSDFESHLLMSTLTRSTTVSLVNTNSTTNVDAKKGYPFKNLNGKFFDLPKYEEEDGNNNYQFEFDDFAVEGW